MLNNTRFLTVAHFDGEPPYSYVVEAGTEQQAEDVLTKKMEERAKMEGREGDDFYVDGVLSTDELHARALNNAEAKEDRLFCLVYSSFEHGVLVVSVFAKNKTAAKKFHSVKRGELVLLSAFDEIMPATLEG